MPGKFGTTHKSIVDCQRECTGNEAVFVNTALSEFLCQSGWVGYFPVNSGIRSSNMTAKWFSADFQWWIGRVHFFDASLIAM